MKLSNLNLNLLYALQVVLSERSVALAAKRLHVTPSAVSNALARVRRQLGDPLLVREGRRLVPTARALSLQPALSEAIRQLEAAIGPARKFNPRALERQWSIGVSDYAEAVLMPRFLHQLAQHSPRVSVRLMPVLPAVRERALHTGEASLLVGVFAAVPERCRISNLWRDEMVCIARRGHPQLRHKLSLKQFTDLPHVMVALFGGAGPIDSVLAARGLKRRTAVITSTFLGAPLIVSNTDCISTVPRHLAEQLREPLGLRLFDAPVAVPGFTMQAMWHERTEEDPAEKCLRKLVAAASPKQQ